MKLKILGTASGEVSSRYPTAFLIETENKLTLFDCGEGIPMALKANRVDFLAIDTILISHFHSDHAGGIAGLLTQMKLLQRKKQLTVNIPINYTQRFINMLESFNIFPEKLEFELRTKELTNSTRIQVNEELNILPVKNTHLRNKYNLSVPEDYFQSFSLHISTLYGSILYTSDLGGDQDLELFSQLKSDLLICETNHIKAESIINFAADNKINRIYLIHYSDKDTESIEEIIHQNKDRFSEVLLAKENMETDFK